MNTSLGLCLLTMSLAAACAAPSSGAPSSDSYDLRTDAPRTALCQEVLPPSPAIVGHWTGAFAEVVFGPRSFDVRVPDDDGDLTIGGTLRLCRNGHPELDPTSDTEKLLLELTPFDSAHADREFAGSFVVNPGSPLRLTKVKQENGRFSLSSKQLVLMRRDNGE